MQPTIGRIVHYKAPANSEYPTHTLAGLVTSIDPESGLVSLCLFGHNGFGWRHNIEQGDGEGQWQWPAKVV